MDYDALLQDRWDRLMLRYAEDQANESIGSSLPDISFDSEFQFEVDIEDPPDAENNDINESQSESQKEIAVTENNPGELEEGQAEDDSQSSGQEEELQVMSIF